MLKKQNLFWNTINIYEYLRFFFRGKSENFLNLLKNKFSSKEIFLTSLQTTFPNFVEAPDRYPSGGGRRSARGVETRDIVSKNLGIQDI